MGRFLKIEIKKNFLSSSWNYEKLIPWNLNNEKE